MATNNAYMSATDTVQSLYSSFTPGSVIFQGSGTNLAQNNSNFFWDNTNLRLGIGTTAPGAKISILDNNTLNAPQADLLLLRYSLSNSYRGSSLFHYYNSSLNNEQLVFGVSGNGNSNNDAPNTYANAKMVIQANGNVGIGTTAPPALFSIAGLTAGFNLNYTGVNVFNNARLGEFMAPNNPVGNQVLLQIGNVDGSANNSGFLGFNYAGGSGSSANYAFISLYGGAGLVVNGLGKVGINSVTAPLQALDAGPTGALRTGAVIGASSTPTVAYGTGAGTGPTTVSLIGTQQGGFFQFTTGSGPTNGVVATFTVPIAAPNYVIAVFQAANNAAATRTTSIISSSTSTTFTLSTAGGSSLISNTTYAFNFVTSTF